MKSYVFMNPDDLNVPVNTLIISWKFTPMGAVLNLDYDSTEDEHVAYDAFTAALSQAIDDNVLPMELSPDMYWYD